MSEKRYRSAAAVTPSNTASISHTAALWIGGAGTLTVTMGGEGNAVVTFTGVPAGTLLEIDVILVASTGTTCTNIVALR